MLSYEQCDKIVKKLVPELLIGTGMQLMPMMHSGRALGVCEHRDAYDLRVGISEPFTRIVRRVEIAAEACHDESGLAREITKNVNQARGELHAELRTWADRVRPAAELRGASFTYGASSK